MRQDRDRRVIDKQLYQYPKLITIFGAAGFVARHLIEDLLLEGWHLRLAVHKNSRAYFLHGWGRPGQIEIKSGNIASKKYVEAMVKGADAVVNLAGIFSNKGNNSFYNAHILGVKHIALYCAEFDVPLIHLSSLAAQTTPAFPFLNSKLLGEREVKKSNAKAIIIRPSLIYGPGDHFFTKQAKLATLPGPFPVLGYGERKFQPLYVRDLTDFIIASLKGQHRYGEIYELGGGEILSYKMMIKIMLRIIDRRKSLLFIPRPFIPMAKKLLALDNQLPFWDNRSGKNELDFTITKRQSDLPKRGASLEVILPNYLWHYRPKGQFNRHKAFDWSR